MKLGVEKSGVEKSGIEKSRVEKSSVEKSRVEKSGIWKVHGPNSPGLKGLGLKHGVEMSRVEMSFNVKNNDNKILLRFYSTWDI